MRRLTPLLLAGLLTGCTAAADRPFVPEAGLAPSFYRKPVTRTCENYADQTYRNSYENYTDDSDGFGVNAIQRQRAEADGRQALARCRAGRLN
ncbi:hypothetical protein [Aureimonas sp. AU4]|uniref:hypothetical protein n=1 Tax=Aureimonas sp. AU4 TaxID=1638163 RepID=UPI000705D1C6|nr:hypothetical protein [Aureimonas sp. AU4]BAT30340.1 hypothetical protein [Aureimonas sp. AU4]